jgi:peptide deformylase
MARLKLVYKPNQILRAANQAVSFPLSPEIRALADQMCFAVKKFHGVGLAAPQVGKNLRMATIYLAEYDLPAFPIFNPEVVSASKTLAPLEEGCLSLPGKFGIVNRPDKITVKFQNSEGKVMKLDLEGLAAVVFQHEIDHLNGHLIDGKWDEATVHEVSDDEMKKLKTRRKKRVNKNSDINR